VGGLNLEGWVFVRASQRGLLGLFGDLLRLTVSILVESSSPEREIERERDPGISEMATIRSPVVAPAFVEGMASKGQQLQSMKFRSSDVFGGRALQDRSRMLHKGKLVVMVEEEDVEKKRCKQQARASMGPADKLPANHKVKAASLKAFEELRNASANRKSSLPYFSILIRRRR